MATKGYRFVGKAENRLALSDFSQITALNDFDMQLKTLLYPRIMLVETALKNYTLEAVLADSKSESIRDNMEQKSYRISRLCEQLSRLQ